MSTNPGFMVMNTEQVGLRLISVPSKTKRFSRRRIANWMDKICCATTDSTSRSIRLNSSKQAHAPDCARPYKKYCSYEIPLEVAETSQIFLRDTYILPKLAMYDKFCKVVSPSPFDRSQYQVRMLIILQSLLQHPWKKKNVLFFCSVGQVRVCNV
jgi:hypothetical protein